MTYKTPCFYGGVQGAYLRGRDVSAHDNLASIPGQKIGTHVGIICTKYNLDLGLRSTFVTTQNRLPQRRVNASRITLKRTPGFGVHDIYAVYEPPYAKGLKVHVGLDNVFNKSYRYHLSALPQQGRNFKISGSITF